MILNSRVFLPIKLMTDAVLHRKSRHKTFSVMHAARLGFWCRLDHCYSRLKSQVSQIIHWCQFLSVKIVHCIADGLGFCANSLELGCDCVGNIFYFDATMNDSKGRSTCIPIRFFSYRYIPTLQIIADIQATINSHRLNCIVVVRLVLYLQ